MYYNILFAFFFLINRKVEDIDLVTALLSEAPLSDSVLGPTFLCLLGRTFRNIRFGKYYMHFMHFNYKSLIIKVRKTISHRYYTECL